MEGIITFADYLKLEDPKPYDYSKGIPYDPGPNTKDSPSNCWDVEEYINLMFRLLDIWEIRDDQLLLENHDTILIPLEPRRYNQDFTNLIETINTAAVDSVEEITYNNKAYLKLWWD